MSCPAFETLSAELDGELSELEQQALEAHVAGCDLCQSTRSGLALLQAAVRRAAVPTSASDALKARLVIAAQKPRRTRRMWIAAGIAAAAALAGLVFVALPQKDVIAEFIGDHLEVTVNGEEPFDIAGSDADALERLFASKVAFHMQVPTLPSAKLLGGRLCHIDGRQVPLAAYEREGRKISLFADTIRNGHHAAAGCEEGVNGFTVCSQMTRGLEYTMVSDYRKSEARLVFAAVLSKLR